MAITVQQFTEETLAGNGVFDVMMRGAKTHVVEEYKQGRIKGAEYSAVYLGLLEKTMDRALQFLLDKDKTDLELALIQAQIDKVNAEILKVQAEVLLVNAQKCVADAQFDKIMAEIPKVQAEVALLTQKVVTETAQTSSVPIDPASVIGKQIGLYSAQTDGYTRDAEQKAAKIMADTWNARRMTDETGTDGNGTNKLNDDYVGTVISKMLSGVGTALT